jgi:excisionase family DNA binding protein
MSDDTPRTPENPLTTQEVCDRLDISKRTLQNWEKSGVIPRVKRDWRGYRVFNDGDVEEIRDVIRKKASAHDDE